MADLLVQRPEGLYCPPGDFYIDPWRAVARAVITHAHSDHARIGHGHYLATQQAEGVLRARLGDIDLQTLAYGKRIVHNGVALSLHAAGHVLGSAQLRLEHGGAVWLASGDYKVEPLNRADRAAGVELPPTQMVLDVKDKADLKRALVICPPSAVARPRMRRFGDAQTGFASGWMQLRGAHRRGGYDRGFVLSDHADWPGLTSAIGASGAGRIIVTHGSVPLTVRYLTGQGLQAEGFGGGVAAGGVRQSLLGPHR